LFFVKFITEAKDFCVFFDGSYKFFSWNKYPNNYKLTLKYEFKNGSIKDESLKDDMHPGKTGHIFLADNITRSIEKKFL
jgi:lysophospholipase L1-like esterase